MARAKLGNVDYFDTTNEIEQAEADLKEAHDRISDLELQLEALAGTHLPDGAATKEATLPISDIVRDPNQARRWFDPVKLKNFAQTIQELGFRGRLWVRRLPDGTYRLIAGERRLRAAELAGLTRVPVDIFEVDDSTASSLSMIENLQREDLNPLEEADIILSLLAQKLGIKEDEVGRLLYRMKNYHEAQAKTDKADDVSYPEEFTIVESFFQQVGRYSWQTFIRNRLRLQNLPPEILDAIRTAKLEFSKANAIAQIKDQEARQALLEQAIEAEWSYEDIHSEVKALKQKPPSLKDDLRSILKIKSELWTDSTSRKSQKIRKLIEELRVALEST